MNAERTLRFKIASEESELEQVFQLNYKTFVEEIPQHPPNPEKRLVDRFHHRNAMVFQGLLKLLLENGKSQRYNLAVISGTVRQQKLYKHLGFVPFGPLVGSKDAQYQPMYLTLEEFEEVATPLLNVASAADRALNPISFLPGPVSLRPEIRAALDKLPLSHRCDKFKEEVALTKTLLCQLVRTQRVEILLGSGTLANDVIAAQLSLLAAPGIILNNGEFGSRLLDHARRFRLSFRALEIEWGGVFGREQVRQTLDSNRDARWLGAVACETSTGVLNDVDWLK